MWYNSCKGKASSSVAGILQLLILSGDSFVMEVCVDREKDGDIDSWKEVQLIYNSALKQISTKLEILNDEFQHVHRYNPIEHIKWRIKTPESIVKKLKKH